MLRLRAQLDGAQEGRMITTERYRAIVAEIEAKGIRCNCDLAGFTGWRS